MQWVTTDDAGRKAELRFGSAAAVETSSEERAWLVLGRRQLDAERTRAGDRIILRIRNHHAHGCRSAAHIRLLAKDVHHRHAEDLGDRFGALDRPSLAIVVRETITQTMPHQVVGGNCFRQVDLLLPPALGVGIHSMLHASQDFIFGVQDLDGELSTAHMGRMVRNADVQSTVRIGRHSVFVVRRLGFQEHSRRDSQQQCEGKDVTDFGWHKLSVDWTKKQRNSSRGSSRSPWRCRDVGNPCKTPGKKRKTQTGTTDLRRSFFVITRPTGGLKATPQSVTHRLKFVRPVCCGRRKRHVTMAVLQ